LNGGFAGSGVFPLEGIMNLYFGAGTNHPVRISTDVRDNMPEDRRYHYKDKRSMAELAKCWLAAKGFLPERISKIRKQGTDCWSL
jgi:hypothetical protein